MGGRMNFAPRMPTILVSLARSGRLRWIGGGRQLTSTTHVDTTVGGLVLAAERGVPGTFGGMLPSVAGLSSEALGAWGFVVAAVVLVLGMAFEGI